MKDYKKRMVIKPAILAVSSALVLSACGGGSSSNSGSTASTSNLSDAQKNYESFALTSNGGLHFVEGSLSFSTNSAGALSVGSSSTFFTTLKALPRASSR